MKRRTRKARPKAAVVPPVTAPIVAPQLASSQFAPPPVARALRGRRAEAHGLDAEALACAALAADGWTVLARRVRTPAGEVDIAAERDGLLALVEVKSRPTLARAAFALTRRQQARLLAAAEILLAEHPEWGRAGVRFDLMLVDAAGVVRRIADAFRDDR